MNYNNRNYNSEFIDTMDEINNRGRGKGFKNGIDWAATAQRQGELAYHTYQQYSNCHDLRVRFSHGNAKDICVSRQTLDTARKYLSAINRSHISRERKHGSVKIPYGGFRAPYIKEFNWQGSDGNTYHFKFEVVNERNYIDNGSGGTYADGYFIHIIRAPYYSFALNHLHEFHIIRGAYENHICWNRPICGQPKCLCAPYPTKISNLPSSAAEGRSPTPCMTR